jgi:hypothetical protein
MSDCKSKYYGTVAACGRHKVDLNNSKDLSRLPLASLVSILLSVLHVQGHRTASVDVGLVDIKCNGIIRRNNRRYGTKIVSLHTVLQDWKSNCLIDAKTNTLLEEAISGLRLASDILQLQSCLTELYLAITEESSSHH